jgi:hypothetical protein
MTAQFSSGSFGKLRAGRASNRHQFFVSQRSLYRFRRSFRRSPLHRMSGNRRDDLDRRFFLLHLDPHNSAGKQRHGNNKCCDDCPFARRFVHR